ncbi:MAG: AraC family transcriptional regulator [Anditalea sp.]
MKPTFLKVLNSLEASIDIRHEIAPYFKNPWHFHPEFELTLILESTGTHFIGNSISTFYKNELTLTGPNLPHYWRCDPIYYQGHNLKAEAIIVRFPEHFLGSSFFLLPEMHHINNLFKISRRGLKIIGETKEKTAEIMNIMMEMDGAERIISLLQILNLLASSEDYKVLSCRGFVQASGTSGIERINDVYAYLIENFMHPIQLNKIASVANMNPTAFCRYFKAKTGKTFTQFLHEIRIGHACKILIEGKLNVSQVCYESGFQNQSYFIKLFKRINQQTPLQYQNQHNKRLI